MIPRRSGGNFSDDDFGVNQVTTVGGSTSVTFVDNIFSTNDPVPDLLHSFNLRDGLVCVNAEQPGHRACQNYQTRYFCGRPGSPLWTQWFDTDSPASDAAGDDESRSKVDFNVLAVCGGAQPIGIAIRRGWIP